MPESLTPLDRLQPCLLDRLTDESPENRNESRSQRIVSLSRYRAGVLRDLEWLFNAIGHFPEEPVGELEFGDFAAVYHSVLNFGIRQLYGRLAPNAEEIEKAIFSAMVFFEPRIDRRSLKVNVSLKHDQLTIELSGELWANPLPEKLFVKTQLDLASSQFTLLEAGHG
jgi:type VI secretion system protein ImpF